jgi:putative membrane protein
VIEGDPMHIAFLLATNHDHWFPFFLIPLFFIGVWVIVFATFGWGWRRHPGHRSGESILADRYARGEIDEQEYRERRAILRSKP